ncbi:hypothetical protein WISP_120337 [Willisornis vidua]|uniref:Uncharacterized protein n=1 Tax=Willisornis vidua TaxID=1566151 RepID=A0ABQ9CZ77_9PASS|nr:hypothetical protein WISP_120337 [Willisornis vidua]
MRQGRGDRNSVRSTTVGPAVGGLEAPGDYGNAAIIMGCPRLSGPFNLQQRLTPGCRGVAKHLLSQRWKRKGGTEMLAV